MKHLRRHLTFANVVACLALFIALGGVGYAALKLPKESVGAEQLRREAVTPEKLSDKAKQELSGRRGPKGTDGAQGKTGPQGPAGPAGAAGPPGEPGPSSVYALSHGEEIGVLGYTAAPLVSLPVPAGSYAIQARLEAISTLNQLYIVTCELRAGNDRDDTTIFLDNNARYSPSVTSLDAQLVPLQLVHTFGEPGQVTVDCVHEGPPNGIGIRNIKITAIKVGAVGANIVS
jgi:hypothetical protein